MALQLVSLIIIIITKPVLSGSITGLHYEPKYITIKACKARLAGNRITLWGTNFTISTDGDRFKKAKPVLVVKLMVATQDTPRCLLSFRLNVRSHFCINHYFSQDIFLFTSLVNCKACFLDNLMWSYQVLNEAFLDPESCLVCLFVCCFILLYFHLY